MAEERIMKVLANVPQGLSPTQQAQARENINCKPIQAPLELSYADYGFLKKLTQDANGVVNAECSYISAATSSTTGLMSGSDKSKLDGIATGAEVNQNAFSALKVGATTIYADSKTDTLEIVAGSNITLTPNANDDSLTISATDTTYTAGSGLYLSGTEFSVNVPVPPPASGSAGKVLTVELDNTLGWEPAQTGASIQKKNYGDTDPSNVSTLLIDSDDPENYTLLKADNVTKGHLVQGPYKTLLDSGINGGSGVGDASTPIYVDTDGTFKAGNAVVTGGKHSHTAELYYHHYDDGDHYNVRNIKNYCINHVVVANHSADICYIEVEAPTLGTDEEYDYYVVFDCTNSSGGCNVTVQNCDAEIFNFPYYNPNGPQGQPYVAFQDKTYTWVELTGSPRYHVEVIGNRYTIHRF